MKRMIKQLLLTFAFVCSLVLGFVFLTPTNTPISASAATTLNSRVIGETGFFIEQGAAVRVKSTSTETNGLRYTVGLDRVLYEKNMAEGSGVEDIVFGILIAPATDKYVLNQATVFGIGGEKLYDWAVKDQNGDWIYTGDKTRIINLESKKLFEVVGKPKDAYYFQGSVVNIQDQNLTSEFRGVGYILYTKDGVRCCEMVSDDTHVRSITYVAQKAIDDGNSNSAWLKTNYIDKATVRTWNYTTENYLEQEDGSFEKDSKVETKSGELGATVTAGTAPTFSGLYYDPAYDLGVSSGQVLANNKLVLKRYYRLGYNMPAKTTPTVKQTSAKKVTTDETTRLIDNVGEGYAAVTFSSTTAESGFTALALNVMGSVENVWVADLTLCISGNGIFLTSGNINDDGNRIARFTSNVMPNNSNYYTIVYKLTYQGNANYANGIKFELWMANHAKNATLSNVTFTKATVGEVYKTNIAGRHYLTNDLVLKYTAVTETQFKTTNCDWMLPRGWNANTDWTMQKAQILSAAPTAPAAPGASVRITETDLWSGYVDSAEKLVENYREEYVSFSVMPASIPTNDGTYGICLNMLGETYNSNWKGGLILKLSNDGLYLWKNGVNESVGEPIALLVSKDHNYNWAGGFSICYKFDFSNEYQIVMELYLKMGDGEYTELPPQAVAAIEGFSYKDGKFTMRKSMFNFSPAPDSTIFAHQAYNSGCEYWTISNVALSTERPIQEGYENPTTGDAVILNVNPIIEIDHTVNTIKTLVSNVNENYVAITLKASNLTTSTYYSVGINVIGTTQTGLDGGLILSLSKDGVFLRYGGMNGMILAQLNTGNIARLDTAITVAYKVSFGEGKLSDRVGVQFWTASAGSAFAPMTCIASDNLCTYDSASQTYYLPYALFEPEEYKSDCTMVFLSAHNNQTVPCDWEIQDIEILSESPSALTSYWANPAYAGISVDANGTMYLGTEKLYTAGVNCYSLFNQCWSADASNIKMTMAQKSLDTLKNKGIKVVRFNCGGYLATSDDANAKTIAMYEGNKDTYIQLLKNIAAYAEDVGIGLIPSFFWLYSAVPSYCGEAVSAWGNANSKTRAYMVEYTTTIVNELKGFQSIFGWEFGNEFNLHCDIPGATEDFKLEYVNSAISAYNATIKGLDVVPNRFIGSGHSAPRPAQYNLSINNGWTTDTDAQYSTVTSSLNPCNAISEHVYHDTTTSAYSTYFTRAVKTAANLKKAYYVGEWGHGDTSNSDYNNQTYYQNLANAIIGAKVQLSLLWNYDITRATEKSFATGDTRSNMLWDVLASMNATMATMS